MSNDASSAVAIVGIGCRVPGARTVDEFWANLCAGIESIRRLSPDEMIAAGLDPDDLADPYHVPVGALIEDVDRFDAAFFGMTAREAELMDPQQRLLLECAWTALEHAGHVPSSIDGAVGVFAGANFDSYLTWNLLPSGVFEDKAGILQAILANDKDYLATRIAYKLNLRGPAYTVQCGCSTSLVAVHLGMQALRNYECDYALAGGVAVDVVRPRGYWAHAGSVFAPDGHCRAFDASARGTVFGNGCAMVVLKRLDDAIRDGDTVYAAIVGSAVNNDGSVKVGFTAPSVGGQTAVIAEALADAGVTPHSIGMVEAHGTGTPLGDPIEVEALTKAFGPRPPGYPQCAIGSVKTNVGHLDSAAGVVGLIKAALAVHHGLLPASLNFTSPNPAIVFEQTPFYVNRSLAPWQGNRAGWPRRAGVSSFGMGGTNAHLVIEDVPVPPAPLPARRSELLIWSARTPQALDRMTMTLCEHLRAHPGVTLADVAYTLQVGRAEFPYRRSLACDSVEAAVHALGTLAPAVEDPATERYDGQPRRVAFLFTGGGGYRGMGRELYDAEPSFRAAVDACAAGVLEATGSDLRSWLLESAVAPEPGAATIDLSQPSLFAMQYGLASLWRTWGVEPAAVGGEGVGELAAACHAGVCSPGEALRLVVARATGAGRVAGLELSPPSIPLLSTQSGEWVTPEEAVDAACWLAPADRPGAFANGLATLHAAGPYHLLEIGPGARLTQVVDLEMPAGVRAVSSQAADPLAGSTRSLLDAAGRLWQAGVAIHWPAMHAASSRRRIALPTYSFERTRYWIDPPGDTSEHPSVTAAHRRPTPAEWLYVPSWKQTAASAGTRRPVAQRRWLIFSDADGPAAAITALLEQAALPHAIIVVRRGSQFRRESAHQFVIDPARADDYSTLLSELDAAGALPEVIVHAWSLANRGAGREAIAAAQHAGFYSLLHLVRAVERVAGARSLSLRVLTRDVQDVHGTEDLDIGAATMTGLLRVIAQERSSIDCSHLDLESGALESALPATAQRVLEELSIVLPEPAVALRGSRRLIQSFDPIRLARPAPPAAGHVPVYAIIGGLGRIGLSLAEHLARTRGARLMLIGRSGLPPRDSWREVLDSTDGRQPVVQRIRRVQELEAMGADVILWQADAGDAAALESAFAAAERRFGRLDGVIATAGIIDAQAFRPAADLTVDECERQFRPKIDGLFALAEALERRDAGFCLLVSSLSSVLGGYGYGAYSAANAFMDSFARARNRGGGTPWISVNWDAWRWTDAPDGPEGALARLAMTPGEASEIFDRVVGSGLDQVVVSTSDLHARVTLWVNTIGARASHAAPHVEPESAPAPAVQADRGRGLVSAASAHPASSLSTQDMVIETWQQALGLTEVDLHETFLDLGGNSLTAVQAISALEQRLGIRIPIEEFIFQTAAQLTRLCSERLASQLAATAAQAGR